MQTAVAGHVRDITDDEVEAFRRDGWVKLAGLVSPALTATLLAAFKEKLDADAQQPGTFQGLFTGTYWRRPSLTQPTFLDLVRSPEMGQVFRRLKGRDGRYYIDTAITKPPRQDPSGVTVWHQDFPNFPFDRTCSLAVWIALDDVEPEQGSLQFLTGSQRSGSWGVDRPGVPNAIEAHPELLATYELSEPPSLRAGDATVHDGLIFHTASENRTDRTRYSFVEVIVAADALYTGQPMWRTDEIRDKLEPFKPFPDDEFPRL